MRTWGRRLLLLLTLLVLLASCAPIVKQLPTPTGGAPSSARPTALPPETTPQPALLEQRQLILEWPETLRERDSSLIVLTIAMNEPAQPTATLELAGPSFPVDIPNIYDTHNIVAVARLDLAGMEAYREEIREPMRPGQPITIPWSIRAGEAGTYRGVVWLRLELIPKNGGPVEERLLLSRAIEIRVVTVLGMSGSLARLLGGAGLVISTILGYPFIQSRVGEWLKRRRKGGQRPARRTPPENPKEDVSKKPDER